MADGSPESRVLAPLVALAAGTGAGGSLGLFLGTAARPAVLAATAVLGAAALAGALSRRSGGPAMFAAGLALAFASAAHGGALRARAGAVAPAGSTVRATFRVLEGWAPSRWGSTTRIRLLRVRRAGRDVPLLGPARLEVRGRSPRPSLPPPGSRIESLLAVRAPGRAGRRPFLVAPSASLLQIQEKPGGIAAFREGLARRLLLAAGTSVRRIRGAEIAAALALGRRDLVPAGVRQRWRASGLAHVLAVSGLHVGVVSGVLWFLGTAAGLAPTARRWGLLAAVPLYVLLAGAAPSAVRAGVMLEVYLAARLAGRHVVPLGAVLLAAAVMILVHPSFLLDPGFQLTVVITAALLRWTAPLAALLPLPRTIALAAAVPVVAQAAALPLVAWHFRDIAPGAILSNLLVLGLLPPLVVLSLAAAAAALAWPPLGAALLSLVTTLSGWTLAAGAMARRGHVTVPTVPPALAAAGLIAVLAAVLPGPAGRRGLAGLLVILLATGARTALGPPHPPARVTLLPVEDGASVLLEAGRHRVLVDGGRWRAQADRLLADRRIRTLDTVVATHTDEDHVGGLDQVLQRTHPRALLLPRWMLREPAAVPLLRAAHSRDTQVVPLVRGVSLKHGELRLTALWPPLQAGRQPENDRSLVLAAEFAGVSALLPADTTARVESLYLDPPFRCGLLVVPHHGSRSSCGDSLIRLLQPRVALIPAGPGNRYHHPHRETLRRLRAHHIPFVVSRWTPWCAAELDRRGRWRLLP